MMNNLRGTGHHSNRPVPLWVVSSSDLTLKAKSTSPNIGETSVSLPLITDPKPKTITRYILTVISVAVAAT